MVQLGRLLSATNHWVFFLSPDLGRGDHYPALLRMKPYVSVEATHWSEFQSCSRLGIAQRPCHWCVSEVLLLWVIYIDCSLCDSKPLCSCPPPLLHLKPLLTAGRGGGAVARRAVVPPGLPGWAYCAPCRTSPLLHCPILLLIQCLLLLTTTPTPSPAATHPPFNTPLRHTARQGQRSLSTLPWRCRTGEM